MADILHDFFIKAPAARVFDAVSSPRGLDAWWTKASAGTPAVGEEYTLDFGPGYVWRARVTRCLPPSEFELQVIDADADWTGTRVGFALAGTGERTTVRFHHSGWPSTNEHFRISSHCWAMYLRVLRRWLEHDEQVPYDDRLDV